MNVRVFISVFIVLSGFSLLPAIGAELEPYSIEDWAKRADMNNVSISSDGNRLALLKIPSAEGNPVLEVYDANDLSIKPFVMDASPMEITRFYWATDNQIIFTARQKIREKIGGFNDGAYGGTEALLTLHKDPDKNTIKQLNRMAKNDRNTGGGIRGPILGKPGKFITYERKKGSRSPVYYEYDVLKGTRKLITRGSEHIGGIQFDGYGNPQFASGYDGSSNEFLDYYRAKGSNRWEVINRQHRENFEGWRVYGTDPLNPDDLLVVAHNGGNTAGLWSFDPKTKQYKELIYRRPDGDVFPIFHSNRYKHPDVITGVRFYDGRELKREFFDEEEKAIYEQLKSIIPNADRISIRSRSKDGMALVVYNRGPRDPGTFYLLKNGKFQVIGSEMPWFSSDRLADVEEIKYKSRDGKLIRGFITIPNSEGPHPLVVMPHGGPFVPENPSYDGWAQLLANYGYMVLQPQYRGSTGYGLDFYKSAFINGGEGGGKMQDDKDDGALFLAEQGLVDPNRMAMFGWSYGGYAALIAASREDQIYQCAIAGAAVADNIQQLNYYRGDIERFQTAGSEEQIRMWADSISPIKEVEKVNIPLFVIHGDIDQRVPPKHARKYLAALEKANIPHKALWLEGADHFYSTLFYRHNVQFYTQMLDFLKNDCFGGSEAVASK